MLKTVNVQSVGRQMFMHAFFDLEPVNLADSGDPSAGARLAGGLHGHTSDAAATSLSFLTYKDKFLAGGWRFLTYFGRDTLITLRLMMVLGGAFERINITTGWLCHEETIGDYASWLNLNNNPSDLGDSPLCDYQMLDTDYHVRKKNHHPGTLQVIDSYLPSKVSYNRWRNSYFRVIRVMSDAYQSCGYLRSNTATALLNTCKSNST
jgi:hypothetical protein